MLLEMHCHTSEHSSCSSVSAVELIRQVFGKGLQGIVFTDHHYLWSEAELAAVRLQAAVPEYFLLLSGQEINTPEYGDVLVYGATEAFVSGTSTAVIRQCFPDAALVWAHPYRHGREPATRELLSEHFAGVEIFNSNHTVRENSHALQDWHRWRFTALGGTDTHGGSYAGLYPTHFDHPVHTIDELAAEIRHGRCRPFIKEIPHAGANSQVTEVTIGTKGADEVRERIVIREMRNRHSWTTAERAFQVMEQVAGEGFSSGPYRVPKPIDKDPASMTLIEQGVRGKSLFDKLLTARPEDGTFYVTLAAEWLARLHNCRLAVTPPAEFLTREQRRLERYLQRFSEIDHKQTRKVKHLIEAVLNEEARIVCSATTVLVQGHGDFHPKNIFIGQDNQDDRATLFVAAIDFESSLMLPRSFDVGCFLAQFRNQFFAHPEILRNYPDELFIDAYLRRLEEAEGDFLTQVQLFRARTNLSIAAYLIKVGLGDSEDLWRVLVEAEQSLSGRG
ncbi:phosphotransferase [Geotalea uraniireducens]|uniref:Phosphotransferase n=1 Tax=Geotalea uraniireducens TaxID=351604 RepID=A0ABN6VPV8_9BACT|nr:phosphotransferase [Geotalea uraniireducens]BDV42361.1 phosphotransferase [Geotalea uraniireducens]